MARAAGLEPTTCGFGDRIALSYLIAYKAIFGIFRIDVQGFVQEFKANRRVFQDWLPVANRRRRQGRRRHRPQHVIHDFCIDAWRGAMSQARPSSRIATCSATWCAYCSSSKATIGCTVLIIATTWLCWWVLVLWKIRSR